MKILMIFAAFLSVSALASDVQSDEEMRGGKIEIPNPIPIGYPYCVLVLWNHPYNKDVRGSFFDAPHSVQDISDLNTIRDRKLGTLHPCIKSEA